MKSSPPAVLVAAVFLVSTLLLCSPQLHGREPETAPNRPKIGLVLSGGGALGMAHIGVLKAFEELHIPIDCIAGTSMGSIVGGLYASGMSAAEIDDWFRTANWQFLLSDKLPRESESFRKKQRQFEISQGIGLNVSHKGEIKLPVALVTGRNIMASLRQLTVPVRHIRDFDQLPIPFRAMATDFENGDPVVLRDGDLVESMRVSMSVPALFKPLRLKGRLLADGGMASNLPIGVVQTMNPDVIIAVDVGEVPRKEADLDTATVVANQVLVIFTQQQTRREVAKLGPRDLLLRLDLEGLAATDFMKATQAIASGYRQAMERKAELQRFSVSPAQYARFLARQRLPRGELVEVSFLKVRTPEGDTDHPLRTPVQFDVRDHDRLVRMQSLISDLGTMQKFEAADYEIIEQDGRTGLLVKAYPGKIGPIDLSFGFRFGYDSAGDGDYALLLGLRMSELNSLGAEWKSQLTIGDASKVQTEFLQPLDPQRRLFLAAQALFSSELIDGLSSAGDPLRFRLQQRSVGLDIGARLWQAGEVRLGVARGLSNLSNRVQVPSEVPSEADLGWAHADFIIDTLDAPGFATRGTYGSITLLASRKELGASNDYTRLAGQFYRPITVGKNTIVPRISGSVKIGDGDVPLYDQTALGGFLNLSGLSRGSLFGQNAALAELVYYRKVGELPPALGGGIHAGFSVEAGEVWAEPRDFRLGDAIFAGSAFLGAETQIGALYFGVGVAEGGNTAIYLQLGSLFGQGRDQR